MGEKGACEFEDLQGCRCAYNTGLGKHSGGGGRGGGEAVRINRPFERLGSSPQGQQKASGKS